MDTVKIKGVEVLLKEDFPQAGASLEEMYYIKQNLNEESIYDIEADVKVILTVSSLDTGVCANETRMFNELMSSKKGVKTIVVSKDLPFALKRFCETNGIENVEAVSDYRYHDFGNELGVVMSTGPLKGLLARAVIVANSENKVVYSQLVPDILQEPDYKEVEEAVDKLL